MDTGTVSTFTSFVILTTHKCNTHYSEANFLSFSTEMYTGTCYLCDKTEIIRHLLTISLQR